MRKIILCSLVLFFFQLSASFAQTAPADNDNNADNSSNLSVDSVGVDVFVDEPVVVEAEAPDSVDVDEKVKKVDHVEVMDSLQDVNDADAKSSTGKAKRKNKK